MFEGVVATVLNRYLGKYIQDLDIESLNIGIFSGNVQLVDLRIKPEALYELDLPIEVKVGVIGKINLSIPWGGLYTQSVVATIEDVYIIAGPVLDREYDPEKEKRLMRAAKRKKLEDLEAESLLGSGPEDSKTFTESLLTTIINNLQIFFRNIHIRYEDTITNRDHPFFCGFCVQNVSLETTNSKWKPAITAQNATSFYQLIRLESFSVYWNPKTSASGLVSQMLMQDIAQYNWRNEMRRGLEMFSTNNEDFDFIVKPVTAKIKVIINKSNEARVPKLLLDFVLQDAATQLSRQQYLSITELSESFKRMNINRKYRQFHPGVPVISNSSKWWKYAYNSVLEQRVRPYSWTNIKKHREYYLKYKDAYKKALFSPNDTELKLDLQQLEDRLTILHIIVAREHAKLELHRENPERIHVRESTVDWWGITREESTVEFLILSEKERGLWAQLSSPEKKKICETIGFVEGAMKIDKPKQYIEHKFNFTVANCSLSLINHRKEIVVVTLTQFLASLETRPSAKAFKISMRIESFVVEGTSLENELVPMVSADNVHTGNTSSNFLSIDFEKNPSNVEADFELSIAVEPVEVVYHEHAVSELINFFQTRSSSMKDVLLYLEQKIEQIVQAGKPLFLYTVARQKTISITMDIKGPYIVIPEMGSLQKGGSVMVIDLGCVTVRSDLQTSTTGLEDATQMELEERLYDRLHIDFCDLQLLFCDSGEEWRESLKFQDTDYHLIPKIRCQIVFSNSVKPEYRQLPRFKLNISLASLKLNLSDRKLGMVMDFLDNVPLPSPNTLRVSELELSIDKETVDDSSVAKYFYTDRIHQEPSKEQLQRIKQVIVLSELSHEKKIPEMSDKTAPKPELLEVDRSHMSSDHSDEELELWARTVDLPGFDDNVSPRNVIRMLLRFVIGEVVVQLARSSNHMDKPYIMLRINKVCWDTALMEYGPAIQAGIGGIQLIDKIHTSCTGKYLELVSTHGTDDMVTLLYRKVRSDCPDFKSHFHSVEQSLVLDFSSVHIVFHREAFLTLNKYLQYLHQKIQNRESHLKSLVQYSPLLYTWLFPGTAEPPIPPGATKFSYSTRLGEIRIRLCDTDMEFLELKVTGCESDCMFKANERMVLRVYLTTLTIDDLSDLTLYSKILSIDEDKVFDLKYVRHSPKLYTHSDMEAIRDDVKSDGSFRLHVGTVHIVLLYKLLIDLQHFFEPFIHASTVLQTYHRVEKWIQQQSAQIRTCNTKLHVSLDIHGPTLLLPQKSSSPNVIIVDSGELTVENFFKELSSSSTNIASTRSGLSPTSSTAVPVIDNILVRLQSAQVSRAVMTLAGSLEIQEPILEPLNARLDIKRMVAYHHTMTNLPPTPGPYLQQHRDYLLYDVNGGMEIVHINLGQRDLATLLSVWNDNLAEGKLMDTHLNSHPPSPLEPPTPTDHNEDSTVRKLQAFFNQSEHSRHEVSIRLNLEGIQLRLFSDMDEILSSPVRDMNHGLCKLAVGEATISVDTYSDHSLHLKMCLQCFLLEDIRPDNSIIIKKIFQSHGGEMKMESSNISVSTPPVIDISYHQTQGGDRCINVLVERTRLNFSVPFFVNLGRFILDSLPGERPADGGVVNHGYVGDLGSQNKVTVEGMRPSHRPPSSADSTSGYFSSGASYSDDSSGLSISVQLRKPEMMLFSDLSEHSGHALLLQAEFLLDYSIHPGRHSLVCTLAGLKILSKLQGHSRQPPLMVLYPCDIEFAKTVRTAEHGVTVIVSVSTINLHISASTVHTLSDMIDDISTSMQLEESDSNVRLINGNSDPEDLWSPKKIQPFLLPDTNENMNYSQSSFTPIKLNEKFSLSVPKILVVFEMEEAAKRIPILLFRTAVDADARDWTKQLYLKAEIRLQASYYDEKTGSWEPLIEPAVVEENVYAPWEILIKVFQAKSFPLSSKFDHSSRMDVNDVKQRIQQQAPEKKKNDSEASADEGEPECGMTFIRRRNVESSHMESSHIMQHNVNEHRGLTGYTEDSDSDNEDGVLEKLASAIGHLFTGDSSDGEISESEDSSGAEPSVETEEASEMTVSCSETVIGRDERAVFLKKQDDSIDSGLETESPDRFATYIMIDTNEHFEVLLTPSSIEILHNLLEAFTHSPSSMSNGRLFELEGPLTLYNYLGPKSTVQLVTKTETTPDGKDKVLMTAAYDKSDSLPSSPASTTGFGDFSQHESDADMESFEGGFSYRQSDSGSEQILLSPVLQFPPESVTNIYKKITEEHLVIDVEGFEKLHILAPKRDSVKLHMLQPIKNNTRYYIIVCVDVHQRHRKVTVRSPLQIKNETSYAMGLYYKKSVVESIGVQHVGEVTNPFEDSIRVTIIEPDGVFNVPLYIAYHCKLHVLPAYVDSYNVSEVGLCWQEMASDLNIPKDVFCMPKEEKDVTVFSLRAVCTEGQQINRISRSVPNYFIRLVPPLALYNFLPYAIEVKIPSIKYEVRIEAGEKTNVYFLNLLKMHKICVEVPVYLGIPWSGSFSLTADLEEKTITMATEFDTEGGNKQLGLNLKVDRSDTCDMLLHAPYWIINKTGLPLQIKGSLSDIVYEAQGEEPLLFCYKKHRRRCVRLRAYHSSWSPAFSLDNAGCVGLIVCHDRERKRHYRILLISSLSQLCPQLTRIVTFLPNFIVTNNSNKHLRFMEENERADLWIDLSPGQCVPFWPETESMNMYVKFRDSKIMSQHFPITIVHHTVLRMDKGCGLCVSVTGGGDKPFSIAFNNYSFGEAPVRIDNLCEDLFLKIYQQDLGQVMLLSPYQSMLYTWDDPTKERYLYWNIYNKKSKGFLAEFHKDGYGQERVSFHTIKQPCVTPSTPTVTAKLSASFKRLSPKSSVQEGSSSDDTGSEESDEREQHLKKTRKDKVVVYWVSYLESYQRVLLFTQDERIAYQAQSRIEAEKSNLEMFVSITGLGISLGTDSNKHQKELAYLSITDSAALWEVIVANKWKILTLELASWIEDKWKHDLKTAQMKDYVHVDFEKMQMTKPFFGELRRRYSPGIWLQFRKSDHQVYIHFKIHRLQIDNQLPDAVFPTVLYPKSLPQHIARRVGIKPCIDIAVMKRYNPLHNQDIYKYIKILIQEFALQIDTEFLLSVYDIFAKWENEVKPSVRMRADISTVHMPLANVVPKVPINDRKIVIEYIHLSPLKILFSFSCHGPLISRRKKHFFSSDMIDIFITSFGTNLTEVKGVKLNMAYYEQKGICTTFCQQVSDIQSHYFSQIIQQFYVLVLGIDILGNPYGLITDFSDGTDEFFYEPFLGVMEGPEEFAEGLSYGAQSLFGHIIGGAMGSASLISSSLGENRSSLNFGEDYRKKRKVCLQHCSDIPEMLILTANSFIMGVTLGMSGVVVKPLTGTELSGAQQDGVEGFFRGTGKGLMSLITKPSGGVLDIVGMASDGVKRAVEMGEDIVMRKRLPRYMNPYQGIKPYSRYEAIGMHLLNTLSKGHYCDTDTYWAHACLTNDAKRAVLITLQHVFLLEKCRLWGIWDIEWVIRIDDIMKVPHVSDNMLIFKVRQDESCNFFSGDERHVVCEDLAVLEWIQNKTEAVMILSMEDKPCPAEV
ncbi:vacuolar protein sorting-associated protein 13A-like [Schistocerca piceifrons]|uniref:vacuolar protein sorting-associated protein 13A-like n=1 Tax=Schistocerca piceifrons TaxID=274613 RepID=UPI001F5F0DA8|nr:vacuolar protein sorting-associated protein 13A-like [Schistocerca piceifrons]